MRIVTGACLYRRDRKSVIAEYCGTHTLRLSLRTDPVIVPMPYSVLHNTQLRHMYQMKC